MDCPICTKAMVSMELHDVEVDHCLICGGIWLDGGELELLLGDECQSRELLETLPRVNATVRDSRKCPICGRAMLRLNLPGEKPVAIDECRRHGLWFDKGELHDVLAVHSFDSERKIEKLLADMFGHNSSGEKQ